MNLLQILEEHARWLRSGGTVGQRAVLYGADLQRMDFHGTRRNLRRIIMHRCDLSSANLRVSDMEGGDLSGSDLRRADARWSFLANGNLSNCNLGGADFTGAYLDGCDLTGANLRWAVLPHSTLLLPSHHVVWWGEQLAIDGHQHTVEEWENLSGINLSPGELRWWRKSKDLVFQAIEASRT